MPIVRKTGQDISVFTIDGVSFLCELKNATLTINIQTEEAKGACDVWSKPWAVSGSWDAHAELDVASAASLMGAGTNLNTLVSVVWNSGANNYSGEANITNVSHQAGHASLQKMNVTLMGFGDLTIS